MLKQSESHNGNSHNLSPHKRNLLLLCSFSIAFWLTTKECSSQTPYFKKQETEQPGLSPLDSLVSGPYTQEVKKAKAPLILFQKLIDEGPLLTYPRTTHITIPTVKKEILQKKPGVDPYLDFCLFRKTFDTQRMAEKASLIKWYTDQGYTEIQAYKLHQALCYKLNQPYKEDIILLNKQFYDKLFEKGGYYNIDIKDILHSYLGTEYENLMEEPSNANHRSPDPSQFRNGPTKEKNNFGDMPLTYTTYDRKSAYQLLQQNNIGLRSTALQRDEDGSSYEHGRTCLEGMSKQTVDAIILLNKTLEQLAEGQDIPLTINGGTEKGHLNEKNILIGRAKPGYTSTKEDIRRHGGGFSFDGRCEGQTGILLKKIFPLKKGTIILKDEKGQSYLYKYLFHGKRTALHFHATAGELTTLKKFITSN